MHGYFSAILLGLLPVVPFLLIMFVPNRFFGGKALNKQMEETRVIAERRHQETVNFQRDLLTEMKRHHAALEQQNQLLAKLLDRQER